MFYILRGISKELWQSKDLSSKKLQFFFFVYIYYTVDHAFNWNIYNIFTLLFTTVLLFLYQ